MALLCHMNEQPVPFHAPILYVVRVVKVSERRDTLQFRQHDRAKPIPVSQIGEISYRTKE
jgi:hypothetical protein